MKRPPRPCLLTFTLFVTLLLAVLTGCASTGGATPTAVPRAIATPPIALDPALSQLTLYVASHVAGYQGTLTAFNSETGSVRWTFRTGAMYGAPAIANGRIVVAPQDGNVYALDVHTGQQLWSFVRDEAVDGYPAVDNGAVYISADEGVVYALRASDGTHLWRFGLPNVKDHIYAAPAVAGGMVFVSTGGVTDAFYALDATSGHVRWRVQASGGFDGVPLVAGGVVYAGANDNTLYAMRASDGTILWHFPTGGPIISRPAVGGGLVYIGSTDNTLYAVDARTGKLRWQYAATGTATTTAGSLATGMAPTLDGGTLYLGSAAGNVYALDASGGTVRWQYAEGSNISPAPVVADGAVFVAADDGTVRALRASDGALSWTAEANGAVFALPALSP